MKWICLCVFFVVIGLIMVFVGFVVCVVNWDENEVLKEEIEIFWLL